MSENRWGQQEAPAPGGGSRPTAHPGERREPTDTTMSFAAISADPDTVAAAEGRLTGDEVRSIEALPPRSALLLVQSGANAGARFLLDAERTTVGRHPSNDIFLDDVTVSRKHAEFVREADSFVVRDAGSLNGTYVNRERVDERALSTGDEVQIGKYRLTYHPHRPGA